MNEHELRHKDIWKGTYRGVSYEIVKWSPSSGRFIWNYYLYLPVEQIPEKLRKEFVLEPHKEEVFGRVSYNDYAAFFSDFDWHGGVTYYEKHGGIDGIPMVLQIGCDYDHLWDKDEEYSLTDVQVDTLHTINVMRKKVPDLKYWDFFDGKYYREDEGFFTELGGFRSFKSLKENRKKERANYTSVESATKVEE